MNNFRLIESVNAFLHVSVSLHGVLLLFECFSFFGFVSGKIAFRCSWTEWSTNTWLYKTMFNRPNGALASGIGYLCTPECRSSKYFLFFFSTFALHNSNQLTKYFLFTFFIFPMPIAATKTQKSQTQIPSTKSPCTPSSSGSPPTSHRSTKTTRLIIIIIIINIHSKKIQEMGSAVIY